MRGPSWAWAVAAVAIAALVAVPSLAVLASLANPAHEIWAHLWRTQLPELIGNTLALVAGVGAGTLVVGAGLAWLIVTYRFPGLAVLEWALVLPLAMPAYVIGFALLGLFDFTGPVQGALRRWIGPGARLPEFRSYWGVVLTMTLVFYPYVYLLARAAFREQGAPTLETARSLGRSRDARLRRRHAAAGPALSRRRRFAGHDGGARGFRHRRHVRIPNAHRGRLSCLVRHVRSSRGGPAREPAAAPCPLPPRPRAVAPRPSAIHPEPAPRSRGDAARPVRMESRGRCRSRLRSGAFTCR